MPLVAPAPDSLVFPRHGGNGGVLGSRERECDRAVPRAGLERSVAGAHTLDDERQDLRTESDIERIVGGPSMKSPAAGKKLVERDVAGAQLLLGARFGVSYLRGRASRPGAARPLPDERLLILPSAPGAAQPAPSSAAPTNASGTMSRPVNGKASSALTPVGPPSPWPPPGAARDALKLLKVDRNKVRLPVSRSHHEGGPLARRQDSMPDTSAYPPVLARDCDRGRRRVRSPPTPRTRWKARASRGATGDRRRSDPGGGRFKSPAWSPIKESGRARPRSRAATSAAHA